MMRRKQIVNDIERQEAVNDCFLQAHGLQSMSFSTT